MEDPKQTWVMKFKEFIKECVRVIKVTKKPTMKEYKVILTVSGIGILVIGFIGFLIAMLKQLLNL
jgi:protein transport protein SEC61 subunit gamma and related proteins